MARLAKGGGINKKKRESFLGRVKKRAKRRKGEKAGRKASRKK